MITNQIFKVIFLEDKTNVFFLHEILISTAAPYI